MASNAVDKTRMIDSLFVLLLRVLVVMMEDGDALASSSMLLLLASVIMDARWILDRLNAMEKE